MSIDLAEFQRHDDYWIHPETGVTIADEDMPDELLSEFQSAWRELGRRLQAMWDEMTAMVTKALAPLVEWAATITPQIMAAFRSIADAFAAARPRDRRTETPARSAMHADYRRKTRRRNRRRR